MANVGREKCRSGSYVGRTDSCLEYSGRARGRDGHFVVVEGKKDESLICGVKWHLESG